MCVCPRALRNTLVKNKPIFLYFKLQNFRYLIVKLAMYTGVLVGGGRFFPNNLRKIIL